MNVSKSREECRKTLRLSQSLASSGLSAWFAASCMRALWEAHSGLCSTCFLSRSTPVTSSMPVSAYRPSLSLDGGSLHTQHGCECLGLMHLPLGGTTAREPADAAATGAALIVVVGPGLSRVQRKKRMGPRCPRQGAAPAERAAMGPRHCCAAAEARTRVVVVSVVTATENARRGRDPLCGTTAPPARAQSVVRAMAGADLIAWPCDVRQRTCGCSLTAAA